MKNKKILLGITGGIAAYKSAELIRLLRKEGCEVRVVMTKSAQQFITPITIYALSGNDVYTDIFTQDLENNMSHISLSRWADIILIAPATANFIAKFTHGLCDDLLSTICVAKPNATPIAIAPAMNKEMWHANITQDNLKTLKNRGNLILNPSEGEQACGEYGIGRMLEPESILKFIKKATISDILSKRKVLITAGPTLELIDQVRYISNFSSGKMGYAIADALSSVGASVSLISGPTNLLLPSNVEVTKVTTAQEMLESVMQVISQYDIFISVAAVSDYSPVSLGVTKKIKRTMKPLNLTLKPNADILKTVASLPNPPVTIGFAAETENIIENASKKLQTKKVNMIVANKVGADIGFNKDENHLFVLQKDSSQIIELKPEKKTTLARKLIPIFEELCLKHNSVNVNS
ncbi:MAG: bifunctional phosphopantothenoylcysteine decarboxylase/phosphopantothenate--cysteine ligase CoaBC [Rickettsiales bacterium]|nr:bifunctional phosphopantothenoylcysteine decarboxylase/phosphopantothenate--cysteine ligase CoaBC [Rickettsiales bacterium]